MKVLVPSFTIVEQSFNPETLLIDAKKHIEKCARICYKSEDKVSENSYEKIFNMLLSSKHGAMLEHGTLYLKLIVGSPAEDANYLRKIDIVTFFRSNKYSHVNEGTEYAEYTIGDQHYKHGLKAYYITTNLRVVFENVIKAIDDIGKFSTVTLDDLMAYAVPPTDKHKKRHTVIFSYHLAVARDVNRHRVQSIAEESTRFCNYSKDKFDSSLNITKPTWFGATDVENALEEHHTDFGEEMHALLEHGHEWTDMDFWIFGNLAAEYTYMKLTKEFGWTPQMASLLLPLGTNTTSAHTAFDTDWAHFFDLRALGTTGIPRPSAQEVAVPLMKEFIARRYITKDQLDIENAKTSAKEEL